MKNVHLELRLPLRIRLDLRTTSDAATLRRIAAMDGKVTDSIKQNEWKHITIDGKSSVRAE